MAAPSQSTGEDVVVPPLREDLKLLPAGTDEYGAPCWTIHDPVRNRYFRVGYIQFEMLRRWHLKQGKVILDQVRKETVLTPSDATLTALIKFLHGSGLISARMQTPLPNFQELPRQASNHSGNGWYITICFSVCRWFIRTGSCAERKNTLTSLHRALSASRSC
ncbi:MAG: hypothetical protein ACMZ66_20515 [Thalassospira sp.]|uniref:hypothetical protein n=1 Tax=Thalassospira sp. TaxID=1912094 RepID=UPI003A88A7D7